MYMPGAFAIKVSAGGSRIIKPAAERMKVRTAAKRVSGAAEER